MTRSERLQLIVHQARFLVLQEGRDSLWNSAMLAASPTQWEEVFECRPLVAETFTDPKFTRALVIRPRLEPVGMSRADGKQYGDLYPGTTRARWRWMEKPFATTSV